METDSGVIDNLGNVKRSGKIGNKESRNRAQGNKWNTSP